MVAVAVAVMAVVLVVVAVEGVMMMMMMMMMMIRWMVVVMTWQVDYYDVRKVIEANPPTQASA